MAKTGVRAGRYLTYLSPEFLARFSPDVVPTDGAYGLNRPLTVADCGAVLAVLGRLTNDVLDPRDAAHADRVLELRGHVGQVDLPNVAVGWRDMRDMLGVANRRDVERILSRVRWATVAGVRVFDRVETDDQGVTDFKLAFATARAHPLNSQVRQAMPVDVHLWAAMSCIHSVPIAARLTSWLSTRCRVGLSRAGARYTHTGLCLSLPEDRVYRDLGLAMPTWLPSLLPLDRVRADLASVGIASEWCWSYVGRRPDMLHVRAWRLAACPSAQPAIPGLTRRGEWNKSKYEWMLFDA